MYINVGARRISNKYDIKTKKALKELIQTNDTDLEFFSTDAFGENVNKVWNLDSLDTIVKYTVTGPNPYKLRKWYATVEKLPNGRITVS